MAGTSTRPRPLADAELDIRRGYRERATLRWWAAVLVGIALVVGVIVVGSTDLAPLLVVSAYAVLALAMAVRSAVLLARLRS